MVLEKQNKQKVGKIYPTEGNGKKMDPCLIEQRCILGEVKAERRRCVYETHGDKAENLGMYPQTSETPFQRRVPNVHMILRKWKILQNYSQLRHKWYSKNKSSQGHPYSQL